MAHALAGKPVQEQDIIDVQTIVDAYFDNVPDMTNPTQLVSFGTSGHRGTSIDGTFTDLHVAAITQAICDGRKQFLPGRFKTFEYVYYFKRRFRCTFLFYASYFRLFSC